MDFWFFGIIFVMNYYELIEIIKFSRVTFYSIRETSAEGEHLIWFNLFIKKLEEQDRQGIRVMLQKIGDKYGARNHFFRFENYAHALPSTKVNFVEISENLRLYCLRINEYSVVLFNGGYKDAQTAQESSIGFHFNQANILSEKINQNIKDGHIQITADGRLSWDDDLIL